MKKEMDLQCRGTSSEKGEGGRLALFLFNFFQGLLFLYLEITLLFPKFCCYAFEEKLFFSATIIFSKKVKAKLSK